MIEWTVKHDYKLLDFNIVENSKLILIVIIWYMRIKSYIIFLNNENIDINRV